MPDFFGQVKEYVVENFLFGDAGRITEDTSFLESGIVDSTGLLEIIGFLEEKYGIKIEDEELVPENMDTLKKISAFLARKLGPGVPG